LGNFSQTHLVTLSELSIGYFSVWRWIWQKISRNIVFVEQGSTKERTCTPPPEKNRNDCKHLRACAIADISERRW
jgi:hypothetical protein